MAWLRLRGIIAAMALDALPANGVVRVDEMVGDDPEDLRLLRESLAAAVMYVEGFAWCRRVLEQYFGAGIGGVVAVFLFRIDAVDAADEWIWTVSGDVPSAYLVTDAARDAASALEVYCGLMHDWAEAVRSGRGIAEVFPVDASPTMENAELLEKRLSFLNATVLPEWRKKGTGR